MKKLIMLLTAVFALTTISANGSASSRNEEWRKLKKNASFTRNWNRYPSPDTILSILIWQFPMATLKTMKSHCSVDTTDTHSTLGGNSPETGEPAIQNPNSGFIVWYMGCLKGFIVSDHEGFYERYQVGANAALVEKYLGPKMMALCPMTIAPTFPQYPNGCNWLKLDVVKRRAAIAEQIERLVGPDDVIKDMGLAANIDDFAKRIDESLLASVAKNPKAFSFVDVEMNPTFGFNTFEGTRAVRFMILMADTLKY
ncbi:MAG: hypothetical protein V4760_13505 [Bdellovibrionota bacterium]